MLGGRIEIITMLPPPFMSSLQIPTTPIVGVQAAEVWTAEGDISSNVDIPYLDYKRD